MRISLLRFQAGWLLLPWAALVAFALRSGRLGLSEEGSKALLLAWSFADQVASTVFALGAPDVRAFFFLPLGFISPGEVMAAKLLTLLVMAVAGAVLYSWRAKDDQGEAALLATGLLLIAPLTIDSIDSLAAAPFLLAACGAASWLEHMRARDRGALGGWFFAQLFVCAASVSLHPAGLAYPVVLFFFWLAQPADCRERQVALIGIPLVAVLVLIMRMGWSGLAFAQNPLPSVAAVFGGSRPQDTWPGAVWFGGMLLLALAVAVAIHERKRLLADLSGGTLLVGVLFGAVAADRTWGLLVLALVLYGGLPWLLRACAPLASRGMLIQRGWLWVLLLLISTAFMRTDRSDFEAGRRNLLSAEDELISDFAEGINGLRSAPKDTGRDNGKGAGKDTGKDAGRDAAHPAAILVASPWPARTSIACKCAALPLPPAAKDPQSQLAMMRGLNYLILSDNMENRALAANFSQMGPHLAVLSKQPGGIILQINPEGAER